LGAMGALGFALRLEKTCRTRNTVAE